MTSTSVADASTSSILVVDGDIVSRHVIAEYLRHCGYAIVEAANSTEAKLALSEETLTIDIVLCAVAKIGSQKGLELSNWVRSNRPELQVKLAGGVEKVAQMAAELCKNGPHLRQPYEPEVVVDYIKQLRAAAGTHGAGPNG